MSVSNMNQAVETDGESPKKKLKFTQDIVYKEPQVIAEIGCNHMGEKEIAKQLLTLAKEAGATVGKFQKRCPKELLTPEQYNAPHPNPNNSYGATYGEHREFLELTIEDHKELQDHCKSIGLEYSCSVWDKTSAKEIITLQPKLIKVGSPSNTHFEMMEVLREEYTGEVHISTGMTTDEETERIVKFWEEGKGDAKNRVVLYNCTSGYPVPFPDVCLLSLRTLHEKYVGRVKAIGFSGHHLGIAIDVAAYALGASWVERHFTKDRTWKGTDHAASLETAGLTKLCRDLQATYTAMCYKPTEILEIEKPQRAKLKWGFYNKAQTESKQDDAKILSMAFAPYTDAYWDCLMMVMKKDDVAETHAAVDDANGKLTPLVEAIYKQFAGDSPSMSKEQWSEFLSGFADSCLIIDGKISGGAPGKKATEKLQMYKDTKQTKDAEAFDSVAKEGTVGKAEIVKALTLGKREPAIPPTSESALAQKGICMAPLWVHMKITSQG